MDEDDIGDPIALFGVEEGVERCHWSVSATIRRVLLKSGIIIKDFACQAQRTKVLISISYSLALNRG